MDRRALTEHEAGLIRANPDLGWDAETMAEAMEANRISAARRSIPRIIATVWIVAAAAALGAATVMASFVI